jgi:hypothetical protein
MAMGAERLAAFALERECGGIHELWGSVTSFHFSGFDRILLSGCPSPSG